MVMRRISDSIGGAGVLVNSLARVGQLQPCTDTLTLANVKSSKFERFSCCRETYVCFLKFWECDYKAIFSELSGCIRWLHLFTFPDSFEMVASRHSFPENNGPLYDVNLNRSEEDSQGWGNPGNGLLLDATLNAYVPVDRELTRTYESRTAGQTRTYSESKRKACV